MTDKERFLAVMRFEACDRVPYWEQGFWGGAVARWYEEGMQQKHGVEGNPAYGDTVRGPATPIAAGDRVCFDVLEGAGLDKPTLRVPVNLYLCPAFEEEVLEEAGDQVVMRDEFGIVKRMPRAKDSIPHFQSWPVTDWATFEQVAAERLCADTPERFPKDWEAQKVRLNEYDGVVALGGYPCGFFGAARFLMGEMSLLVGFLETPDLVHKMIDHLADLWAAMYERVLRQVKVDCIHIWEDMAFRNGPLISPALFRTFMVPAYQKVTEVAKAHGVEVILVDTDGDCSQLLPLFLEGGVTGIYPFEVQAGMDVQKVREAFPRLQILGGIDKKELAGGPERIDAELKRRIPGMGGGYIPMADHQVPPDVSWENYLYYRRRLGEICGNR